MKTRARRTGDAPDASGTIWYMGAKTRLLPELDEAIEPLLKPRPSSGRRGRAHRPARPPCLVDLFAGTGVVGARFADRARIIAGDAQEYAGVLARSLLTPAPRLLSRLPRVLERGRAEAAALLEKHADALALEARFLEEDRAGRDVVPAYRRFLEEELRSQAPEAEAARGEGLLLACYRNVYFGIAQAALLDGLRRAIEAERGSEKNALTAALLFAASRATSGTAHFAQPRGLGKGSEVKALLSRRRIDVAALFASRARHLASATRSLAHPGENEVRVGPYETLLEGLPAGAVDVVYADPPYTLDHYSRFYHVLETLACNRVPALAKDGKGLLLRGRYPLREDRFTSRFCAPDRVGDEFRRVGALAAERGAALVWSYSSTNGILLKRLHGDLGKFREILLESHGAVAVHEHPLRHSGAGDKNHDATELIAVCTEPRPEPIARPSGPGPRAGARPPAGREVRCAS